MKDVLARKGGNLTLEQGGRGHIYLKKLITIASYQLFPENAFDGHNVSNHEAYRWGSVSVLMLMSSEPVVSTPGVIMRYILVIAMPCRANTLSSGATYVPDPNASISICTLCRCFNAILGK